MKRQFSALPHHESHDRTKEIDQDIMIRKPRTWLTPNARGAAIQDKPGAVGIAKLKKLSAAMFY
jgi:hypothetical protein